MPQQSAFRNLVNTQYKIGNVLVTKAYLTYEEVFAQIRRDFCDEEANMLMAYLVSTKFPTREQQNAKCESREARIAKREAARIAKEPKITIEDVIKANKKFIPKTGKPKMWNGADPKSVQGKKKLLRVES